MITRKLLCVLLFLLMLGVSITGCGGPQAPEKEKYSILTIATGKDSYGCDWAGKACLYSEGLVAFDSNLTIQPLLAKSWDISEDGKIYTFHLVKGIKFHDGTPFTSAAVKYAFETYYKKEAKKDGIESIKLPDEYTVVFNLKKPNPIFLSNLAVYKEILSPSAVKKALESGMKPEDIVGHVYIGTGPFKFKEWIKGQKVVFIKNEDYWQGEVKINEIVFKVIPDAQTRVIALEAGDVDLIGNDPFSEISPEDLPKLKERSDIKVLKKEGMGICWFAFNTQKEPFNDLNVRRAVEYAIDVKKIVNTLYKGEVLPAKKGGVISPVFKYGNPNLRDYEYEPEKAKTLLSDAGWTDSDQDGILEKEGKPFSVTFVISSRLPEWRAMSEMIQSQLKNVGIDVNIQVFELNAVREKWKKGDYDMITLTSMGMPHDDPQWHFEFHYSEESMYRPVINDDELNVLIQRLKSVTGDERKEVYQKIQARIAELIPGIYMHNRVYFAAVSDKVQNFDISPPLPWHRYQNLWKVHIGT